jgi:phosphoribosylcarboxyaminoimidazole (NCAIR) mutase
MDEKLGLMRMIFGLIGLLIVVAIVGLLARSQLSAVTQLPNSAPVGKSANAGAANIAEQNRQMQAQVKDQLNEALKAATESQQKALNRDLDSANTDKPAEKTGSAY